MLRVALIYVCTKISGLQPQFPVLAPRRGDNEALVGAVLSGRDNGKHRSDLLGLGVKTASGRAIKRHQHAD